ncbi:carboxypeptidase-like regulatory domain-containing protein [Massilia orientalis]|uniref:Carboxypeptidase-like regulatory domain-containing protein n=1 Tax=Massilia orientalis TaxID=3050128 RepID=A0ACC7M5J4_9BURK
MPCHPATYIAGTVTDAVSHQPVSNAAVRLYAYKARTTPSGCFALGGADALPFEFGVSAPGYKPTIIKPVPGWYWATVELVLEDRPGTSKSGHHELAQDRYNELSSKCR